MRKKLSIHSLENKTVLSLIGAPMLHIFSQKDRLINIFSKNHI